MDIKDIYIYAWTHRPVTVDTEDTDYLLCFVLDKIQRKQSDALDMIHRALEKGFLHDILNQLATRIHLDNRQWKRKTSIDWLVAHLIPASEETYRHLQTEFDQLVLEPDRLTPEYYNIPAELCHPTVFGTSS